MQRHSRFEQTVIISSLFQQLRQRFLKTFFTHDRAYTLRTTGKDTVLQRLSTAALVLTLTSLPTNPLALLLFFFFFFSRCLFFFKSQFPICCTLKTRSITRLQPYACSFIHSFSSDFPAHHLQVIILCFIVMRTDNSRRTCASG